MNLEWFTGSDDVPGELIAVVANFAVHPVTQDEMMLKFSTEYPGTLQKRVEKSLQTNCVFMQGASGDLSPNRGEFSGTQYGEALGDHVVEMAQSIETKTPKKPSIRAIVDQPKFASCIDFQNSFILVLLERAFYSELLQDYAQEFAGGIEPETSTILLNNEQALIGVGEVLCNHSNRLKQRSNADDALSFGYCNGHHTYFPTIEAASEEGYGVDALISPVQIGAGEQMMNQHLINIHTMLRKLPRDAAKQQAQNSGTGRDTPDTSYSQN